MAGPDVRRRATRPRSGASDATRTRRTCVKGWTNVNGEVRRKVLHEYRVEDPFFALKAVTTETLRSADERIVIFALVNMPGDVERGI